MTSAEGLEDDNLQEQRDEMTALDNILNDLSFASPGAADEDGGGHARRAFSHREVVESGGLIGGRLDAHLATPTAGVRAYFRVDRGEGVEPLEADFRLTYLPPVRLNFCLPADYPAKSMPRYHLSCPWMTKDQLCMLGVRLDELWAEGAGCVILFTWLTALQEETATLLGLQGEGQKMEVDLSHCVEEELLKKKRQWKHQITRSNSMPEEASDTNGSLREAAPPPEGVDGLTIIDDDEGKQHQAKSSYLPNQIPSGPDEKTRVGHSERRRNLELAAREAEERRLDEEWRREEERASVRWQSQVSSVTTGPNSSMVSATSSDDGAAPGTSRGCSSSGTAKLPLCDDDPREETEFSPREVQRSILLAKEAHKSVKQRSSNLSPVKSWSAGKTLSGTVSKWISRRAFGFVIPDAVDDGGKREVREYFFHKRSISSKMDNRTVIEKGNRISFVLERQKNGKLEAVNVKLFPPEEVSQSSHKEREKPAPSPSSVLVAPTSGPPVSSSSTSFASKIRLDDVYKVAVDSKGELVTEGGEAKRRAPRAAKDVSAEPGEKEDEALLDRLRAFSSELARQLQDYSSKEEERLFDRSNFTCGVCFDEKIGMQCLKFKACQHVFCRDCMSAHFSVRIGEGQVNSLVCPQDKCDKMAFPDEVKSLVSAQLYATYESKLLETTLNGMSDVLLCPRRHCQVAVLIEREESMARCPNDDCRFVFCIYCKAAFHGKEPCRTRSSEHAALVKEYLAADDTARRLLERRYGRGQLTRMADEFQSENYKQANTRPCPRCKAPIQKSHGCNKMTCNNCGAHFCYLCGNRLPEVNPYSHFNLLAGKCFNRLFEGEDVEDWEFDEWEDADGEEFLIL